MAKGFANNSSTGRFVIRPPTPCWLRHCLVATSDFDYNGAGVVTHILSKNASNATIDEFTYSLDSNGNLTSVIETQNGSTTTTAYTYDNAGQLTGDGAISHTYDNNGNRTGGQQRRHYRQRDECRCQLDLHL